MVVDMGLEPANVLLHPSVEGVKILAQYVDAITTPLPVLQQDVSLMVG